MLSYSELLAKVYEDENIELILESLGCHNIHTEQGGYLIVGSRPDGDNKRSVQIKNIETLRSSIRSKGIYGNLYDIVMYVNKIDIKQAYNFIMNMCGYDENTVYIENPLSWLNKVKRQRRYYDNKIEEIEVLDEKILDQFIYAPINQYINDGLSASTLKEFKIGYDVITKRITTPIYNIKGDLIGVKGRATNLEDEEDYKFFYIYPTDQSKTLYNYYRSIDECREKKEVNVFEAEKSCAQSYEFGLMNTMAIGSSGISLDQLNLLLGLQCDIVLCYDKGVDWDVILDEYKRFFSGKRNVYAILDEENILKDKQSPVDYGENVWKKVYGNRIKIC